MKLKIRKDDMVEVITGNDKGKRGRILQVDRERGYVTVEGVNLRKHHEPVRQTKEGARTGGIEEREGHIHASNVMIVDPKSNSPARIGIKIQDGKRVRITKGKNASGTALD